VRNPDLVVAAPLRVEARALRRGDASLRVLHTGMGRGRARRAARRLLAERASNVAVAGLCGGLDPDLVPGDVVVASELRAEGQAGRRLETRELCAALERLGLAARVGAVVSVAHLARGAERSRLRQGDALAADMESAWLAEGAGARPLAVLRVVLDAPGHELLRPALFRNLRRALLRLRELAPALAGWAAAQAALAAHHGVAAPAAD
jgi:4-hydroxy-3-methylbut-2-enyl diphosphate reductase